MAILDIILLLCFIPAIISGITKGFVRQATQFISLLIGVWAAFNFFDIATAWLCSFIHLDPIAIKIIAFVIILLVVSLAFAIIGRLLTKLIKSIALGWLNVLLGIVFGIFQTILVLGLLIMIIESLNSTFNFFGDKGLAVLNDSAVYNYIKSVSYTIYPFLKSLLTNL